MREGCSFRPTTLGFLSHFAGQFHKAQMKSDEIFDVADNDPNDLQYFMLSDEEVKAE